MTTNQNQNQNQNQNAAAWAWVLQHSATIERFAWRFVRGTSLGHEDFRAELITDLATMFDRYDPSRASASTWIWLRAARVRRTMVRAAVRGSGVPLLDLDSLPPGTRGSDSRSEAAADVISILDRATPSQRMAALSIMRGWDRGEVRSRLGVSLRERDEIVRSLGGAQ